MAACALAPERRLAPLSVCIQPTSPPGHHLQGKAGKAMFPGSGLRAVGLRAVGLRAVKGNGEDSGLLLVRRLLYSSDLPVHSNWILCPDSAGTSQQWK